MNVNKNARVTPQGRLELMCWVRQEGWRVADAAAAAGMSKRTTSKRLALDGPAGCRPRGTGARPQPPATLFALIHVNPVIATSQ